MSYVCAVSLCFVCSVDFFINCISVNIHFTVVHVLSNIAILHYVSALSLCALCSFHHLAYYHKFFTCAVCDSCVMRTSCDISSQILHLCCIVCASCVTCASCVISSRNSSPVYALYASCIISSQNLHLCYVCFVCHRCFVCLITNHLKCFTCAVCASCASCIISSKTRAVCA